MLMTFLEMIQVVDLCSHLVGDHYQVNMDELKKELEYNWGFDSIQVSYILSDMKYRRIL